LVSVATSEKKKGGKNRQISILGFQCVTISWSNFAKKRNNKFKKFEKSWFQSPQVRKKKGKNRQISILGFQSLIISWSSFAKKRSKKFKIFENSWFQSPQVRQKRKKIARFLYWVFSV